MYLSKLKKITKNIFVKREVGFTIIHMLSLLILIYFSILVCYPVTSLMHAKMDRISGKATFDRAFCLRMKSTLTKRGCHFKSSGYRVCKIKKYNGSVAVKCKKKLLKIAQFIEKTNQKKFYISKCKIENVRVQQHDHSIF